VSAAVISLGAVNVTLVTPSDIDLLTSSLTDTVVRHPELGVTIIGLTVLLELNSRPTRMEAGFGWFMAAAMVVMLIGCMSAWRWRVRMSRRMKEREIIELT